MELLSVLYFLKFNKGLQLFGIVITILGVDLLTLKGVDDLIANFKRQNQIIIYTLLWSLSTMVLILIVYSYSNPPQIRSAAEITKIYFITGCVSVFYLPKLLFIALYLIDDIIYFFIYILKKFKVIKKYARRLILHYIGIYLCFLTCALLLFGWAYGRYQYQVIQQPVYFSNLPPAFEGFKIVELADIHASAFHEHVDKLDKYFEAVMKEKPDMIVFCGDHTGYYAEELDGLEAVFYKLQAPYGEYAVLGNHDYGDYHSWRTPEEKSANLSRLVYKLRYLGIRLLRNESVMIHKDTDKIALLGVENWGPPPFQQYGNLKDASKHVPDSIFRILLSHDPHHWEKVVSKESTIELTLSGHTHGMQSGIRIGNLEWSPAALAFKNWGGLYKSKNQYLYVNRGLGYVGIPIRIGMPAEITVITLHKK